MTDAFITRGGRAYRGIEALRDGPMRTAELGVAMGVPTGRVHAYMRWALDAGAVAIVKRGSGGPGNESVWSIGPTPTVLGGERQSPRLPVRVVPVMSSVFAWRP